jgi:diguanylate cyclase (GGDEF)-like protein/PAS domain S-box-containing protein
LGHAILWGRIKGADQQEVRTRAIIQFLSLVALENRFQKKEFWIGIGVELKLTSFSDRRVLLTLGSAILCLVVVAIVSFRGMAVSDESAVLVGHTHRVLETIQDLLLAGDGVDSNSREYGLTGHASYLQAYKADKKSIEQDQATLRELTADNPAQQLRLSGLEWLTSQKILRAETIIGRQDTHHSDAMAETGNSATDDVLDDQFQRSVRDMRGEELGLLVARDADANWRLSVVKYLLVAATGMGLLVAVLAAWSHHRGEAKREGAGIALRDSEEKYRSLLDGIEEYAVFTLNPAGTIVSWNAGAERMHGYTAEEIVGQNFSRLFSDEDIQRKRPQKILRLAARNERCQEEITCARKDGSRFIGEVALTALRDPSGKLRGFSRIGRDLTVRKEAENHLVGINKEMAHLAHSAEHDPLTGLPNRLLLNDRINQAIALARRHAGKVAVLFLDLDGFKHINDSLGHSVGDKLLQSVAARLLACVRTPDTVSRNGGDEFILVLQEMERPNQAAITARRVLKGVADAHTINGVALHVTASVGVSFYPDDGPDAETLIKNADTAMYQAKASGRQTFQFFTHEMNVSAVERQSIEEDLRHALEHHEFVLYYQPKVNLKTGAIAGAEALIRWTHPTLGLLSPSRFIPVAEETGLILPIGAWVLREACQQAQCWKNAGLSTGRMAVNVSTIQFRDEKLLEGLFSVLRDTGLDPRSLELEVTESVLMKNPEAATSILKAVRDTGVRVSVDDFGTGYSSLSYLRKFPVDALKIDQSFLHKTHAAPDDSTIVSAIIDMGRAIGLRVIAEGVETADELAFLKANNCDEAQGYYFSRPVPAGEFVKLLASA